jgi:hypothetical protein
LANEKNSGVLEALFKQLEEAFAAVSQQIEKIKSQG